MLKCVISIKYLMRYETYNGTVNFLLLVSVLSCILHFEYRDIANVGSSSGKDLYWKMIKYRKLVFAVNDKVFFR